jgi:hypothetical protein
MRTRRRHCSRLIEALGIDWFQVKAVELDALTL